VTISQNSVSLEFLVEILSSMNAYRLLIGKPEGKRPLEDQDVGGWITLGWSL
jgi:hypothetical protein